MIDYDRQVIQNVVGVHIRAGHTRDEITYEMKKIVKLDGFYSDSELRKYFEALMDGVKLARKTA